MLRSRQKLGKYRIVRRLAQGGFADVFEAQDTIEGVSVALKIPHAHLVTGGALEDFRREVRLTARLDHPNVLPIKNADFVGEHFVIVYPLGERSLHDRLKRRLSTAKALDYGAQLLRGLAHAHGRHVIHCDVKPDNLILFPHDRLRITDFGIAKLALRTMRASGSGTVGFVAPEQAMGRPSFRSDVFSAGLVLYRMLAGALPEWPFDWPPPGHERIARKVSPELVALLRKSLELDPYRRFADAREMLAAWTQGARAARPSARKRTAAKRATAARRDWKEVQRRQFLRSYRGPLEVRHACARCDGPVAEAMVACPWCGASRARHRGETDKPAACPRCRRGVKLDWRYCGWCHGAAIGPLSERSFPDRRYAAACRSCRGSLLPFTRYCPWCRAKVRRSWPIEGTRERCPSCAWGVLGEYWTTCPWCTRTLNGR